MNGVLTLTAALLALASSPAHADPAEVAAAWAEYRTRATFPVPELDDKELAQLDAGELVKLRLPREGVVPVGAMVLMVTEQSQQDMWLASLDSDQDYPDDFLFFELPVLGSELQRWYGFMDIPAPFDDRHFVVRTTINTEVAAETGGRIWERWWRLDETGKATMRPKVEAGEVGKLDLETFDKAEYLPANRGAWIFVRMPEGRLLFGYHTAASLGGAIPDGLVTGYLFRGLDKIALDTQARAEAMRQHYTGGHKVLMGGTGQPVSRY